MHRTQSEPLFTLTGGANCPNPLPLREMLKGERGTRNLAATPDEPHARLSRPDRPPELHAPKPPGSDLTAGMDYDRVIVPSLLAAKTHEEFVTAPTGRPFALD